jgi:hypothetical protein
MSERVNNARAKVDHCKQRVSQAYAEFGDAKRYLSMCEDELADAQDELAARLLEEREELRAELAQQEQPAPEE